MRAIFISLLAGLVVLTGAALSGAAPLTRSCSEVTKVATIQYAPSLILNVYGDSSEKTCTFYVSLPPDLGDSKGAQAVQAFRNVRSDFPEASPALDAALEKIFAPALTAALIAPLTNAEVRTGDAAELMRKINEETQTIDECASRILISGQAFERRSELISCGRVDAAVFGIEARYQSASIGLELPLQ
ncbi:hypothetical protein J2J97_08435 [Rhizobium bangladeshense]|uniref:hypothetical protein n=1 Tax=Rhizobium bangladeshense TaxID=1138189 RepID=UPI001A985AE9|nr:hypothetical protein [Rhizobium bangladeshense]QSY95922.1 hypothetical protein J2J97_08435 [Rhizobium bangladeshense]